jgi:hypothetical protein
MPLYQTILEFLAHLIWPVVAVWAVWMFRDPIHGLLGNVKQVTTSLATIEFRQQQVELAQRGLELAVTSTRAKAEMATAQDSATIPTEGPTASPLPSASALDGDDRGILRRQWTQLQASWSDAALTRPDASTAALRRSASQLLADIDSCAQLAARVFGFSERGGRERIVERLVYEGELAPRWLDALALAEEVMGQVAEQRDAPASVMANLVGALSDLRDAFVTVINGRLAAEPQ